MDQFLLRCRQAAALKNCVGAITCPKGDQLYPALTSTVGLASVYAYLCQNETSSGYTALTLQKQILLIYSVKYIVFLRRWVLYMLLKWRDHPVWVLANVRHFEHDVNWVVVLNTA